MFLAIDIGNTRAKLTLIDRGEVVARYFGDSASDDAAWVDAALDAHPEIDSAAMIVSSAGQGAHIKERARARIRRRTENGERRTENGERRTENNSQFSMLNAQFLEVRFDTPTPLRNPYACPTSEGADRLAAAVGAATLFPQQDVLVVDLGTAISLDVVSAAGEFVGGNISLGLQMRLRAIHEFTRGVPRYELRPDEPLEVIATSLRSAIVSGVVNGIAYEIAGTMAAVEREFPGLKTIFTGGDGEFFASRLNFTTFVEPNLVAIGLNRIFEFNYELSITNYD